jgi:hypothetical protein
MMKFKETSKGYFEATNSLKTVYIHQSYITKNFMLYMPDGDLYDNFTSAGPFVSFDLAKRYAETNVGFTFKKLADALDAA